MPASANNALVFLLDTLLALYTLVVLVRVLLQVTHSDFRNPISQFVWRATLVPVATLARVIPRWRNLDIPALVFALALCFVNIEIDLALLTPVGPEPGLALWWALLKAIVLVCNLYFFTLLIQALMSWISPGQYTPATALLHSLNEPLLRPVRRLLPTLGGLDLSPLVVIIALQVLSRLLPLPGILR